MWFFLRQVNHDWVSFCDHQVLERLQEEEQEGYDPGRLTGTSAIFDGEKDLKEQAEAAERLLAWLPRLLPAWSGIWRCPGDDLQFGMLKWLDPARAERWNWERRAYLGLAFD